MLGGIIIPTKTYANEKLTKATVIGVGPKCRYNIEVGDVVLYDTMSAYGDYFPYVITKEENIIIKF
jgi:co-chaperonin GroES (HSP10)